MNRKPPSTAPSAEQYLTAREVADQLKVSLTWVTVHASGKHRPYIPSIKMGRTLRFRQSDIDAFVQHCQRRMDKGLPLYG